LLRRVSAPLQLRWRCCLGCNQAPWMHESQGGRFGGATRRETAVFRGFCYKAACE
jgi:hypothetical protein